MEQQERCLKASIDKQEESVVLLEEQMSQQSSTFCEAINQQGQKIDLMCNVFTGRFNQLYSTTGVKAPNFQTLQLQCYSQVNPIAGYLIGPDNTTVHIELPIAMTLHKQSLALGLDRAGDPPSSPPQVEVQVATEAHIEPLRASPTPDIPEPALGFDEAGDPPSLPLRLRCKPPRGHIQSLLVLLQRPRCLNLLMLVLLQSNISRV